MKFYDTIDNDTPVSQWHRPTCNRSSSCDCARVARILRARKQEHELDAATAPTVHVTPAPYTPPKYERPVLCLKETLDDESIEALGGTWALASKCECHYHRQQRNINQKGYPDDCTCEQCREARVRRNEKENEKARIAAGLDSAKPAYKGPRKGNTTARAPRADDAMLALASLLFK